MTAKEENIGLDARLKRSQEDAVKFKDQNDYLTLKLRDLAKLQAEVTCLKAEKKTLEDRLAMKEATVSTLQSKLDAQEGISFDALQIQMKSHHP